MLKRFLVLIGILTAGGYAVDFMSAKVFFVTLLICALIALVAFVWAALILSARVDSDGPDS